MKTLIVEDDFPSRVVLQEFLRNYGKSHIAVNGREAVDAVHAAMDADEPYDLICLDIMMPEMDGQQALREIRALEDSRKTASAYKAKIVMTTALADYKSVSAAYASMCDGYVVKPIIKSVLIDKLHDLRLIG
jgi:two-component system, chemotaxis family, chemotaxis protein CheY